MTTFQKDSFTITIPTGGDPVEDWMDLISEIGSIFFDAHAGNYE